MAPKIQIAALITVSWYLDKLTWNILFWLDLCFQAKAMMSSSGGDSEQVRLLKTALTGSGRQRLG